jgi:hypothetical protein
MIPFIPQGNSAKIAYSANTTTTSTTFAFGSYGVPNCLYIVNPDTANVVTLNYSWTSNTFPTTVPSSGTNGAGIVVGSGDSVQIRLDSTYKTGNLYVGVAGISGSGNVFVTPGVL